jgi:hypothetical protein
VTDDHSTGPGNGAGPGQPTPPGQRSRRGQGIWPGSLQPGQGTGPGLPAWPGPGAAAALVRMPRRAGRFLGAAAALLIACALAGPVHAATLPRAVTPAAQAAACQAWVGGQPPSPGPSDNILNGVAVLSPCNAWTVGEQVNGNTTATLIEHWNGASWSVVPSPNPGTTSSILNGVRAASANDVWAVGTATSAAVTKTLILHWDGSTWKRVTSPSPGATDSELRGVRTIPGGGAWAVGSYTDGTTAKTLTLHWDGSTWKRVPSPSPGASNVLQAVAATSASDAWAVGNVSGSAAAVPDGTPPRPGPPRMGPHRAGRAGATDVSTLILHWNGSKWVRVTSPSPGSFTVLEGAGVVSSRSAWAVGITLANNIQRTFILRWNGKTWARVPSPNAGPAGTDNDLWGVTSPSAGSAWAVGNFNPGSASKTLVLHWNGSTWSVVRSPNPGHPTSGLLAVAASSVTSVWAVGTFGNSSGGGQALAIHCC